MAYFTKKDHCTYILHIL